ncbi:hypothetical protein [Lysobacter gummosus]|uniref:hypothetical protein n=1 Tax=Lysobacter gummosus TaxID=262324 RepID=UPI00362F173C
MPEFEIRDSRLESGIPGKRTRFANPESRIPDPESPLQSNTRRKWVRRSPQVR